jgi:hypothetical protein
MSEASGNHNKIRVIVRVRPFLVDEVKAQEQTLNPTIKIKDNTNEIE